jgi:hypothetical protein
LSYGLVCLKCRKYIAESKDQETEHVCKCERPVPSWDAKTEADRDTLTPYVRNFL